MINDIDTALYMLPSFFVLLFYLIYKYRLLILVLRTVLIQTSTSVTRTLVKMAQRVTILSIRTHARVLPATRVLTVALVRIQHFVS